MNNSIKYKILFCFGIVCGLLSFLFDIYTFSGFGEGKYINWSYNPLFLWYSDAPLTSVNLSFKPIVEISIIIPILLLSLLVSNIVIVFFKDVEQAEELQQLSIYAYLLFSSLIVLLFYIVVFPFYLIENELYFPFLIVYESISELTISYNLCIGYILFILSFIAILPYTVNYYYTTRHFENGPQDHYEELLQSIHEEQETLDLDKMIAEENIRIGEYEFRKMEEERIRERILRTGGI